MDGTAPKVLRQAAQGLEDQYAPEDLVRFLRRTAKYVDDLEQYARDSRRQLADAMQFSDGLLASLREALDLMDQQQARSQALITKLLEHAEHGKTTTG